MDPPSNLPSAKEFIDSFLQVCSPEEYVKKVLSLNPRFEIIVQSIRNRFDNHLRFLDYFDEAIYPNPIHLFIAKISLNFDYLIEYALETILPKEDYIDIVPIITKDDFLKYKNVKN